MAWGVSEWMLVLVMDERQRDARRCGDKVQSTISASGGEGGALLFEDLKETNGAGRLGLLGVRV